MLFEDKDGQIMHGETAGGHGGGATSFFVRHATDEEKARFYEDRAVVAVAPEPEPEPEPVSPEPTLDPA